MNKEEVEVAPPLGTIGDEYIVELDTVAELSVPLGLVGPIGVELTEDELTDEDGLIETVDTVVLVSVMIVVDSDEAVVEPVCVVLEGDDEGKE